MCKTVKKIALFVFFVIGILTCFFTKVDALEIHPVIKNGRQIQLDGFLLEWNKADEKPLGKDLLWSWDVINTREGLTGYFRAEKLIGCKGQWAFRFLPCRLSPYQPMEIRTDTVSGEGQFFRVSRSDDGQGKDIICEWIIPWAKVCHDSAGSYQIGLFAFDSCGDSLQPLILTGHVYNPKKASWSGVYGKIVLLGVLLVLLFILQKTTRGKFRKRK